MGYSEEEISAAPPESNLGLGCGNPVALAALKEGETVLDMGSGAGFDCFLASTRVGAVGKGHRGGHHLGDGGQGQGQCQERRI